MAINSASYQGTPNNFTFGARKFKPYRGSDVKEGPGGYVKIRGAWATLYENPACGYSVDFLGWGNTFGGPLSDFTPEEQELLKTTLG